MSIPAFRFCPQCGSPLPEGARFCSTCGHRIEAPEAPQPAPADREPPVPAALREKFEAARAELRGQRREVVVLFADISGYTALSERLDPEEVTLFMQGFLGELAAEVFRYEGYVDKYIGDAVMALFGAPLAHENDPERAVLAALGMLQVTARRKTAGGLPVSLRVGLNLGEVVAGEMGSKGYTVMGDAVNVAARLESAAGLDSILISHSVYERIHGRFDVQEVPPLTVKGKTEPLRAYQVLQFRTAAQAPARAGTPFVGRDEELAAMESFFGRVFEGEAHSLLIEADAGVGKSRLLDEALARTEIAIAPVRIQFSAIELPGSVPVATELLRQIVPLADGAGVAADPAELAGRAGAILGELSDEHDTGIEGLTGPLAGAGAAEVEDPQAARQNRWLALSALIGAISDRQPLLVVFEDIHWADEAGQDLVRFLVPAVEDQRTGIILTARQDSAAPWINPGTEHLVLGRLDQGSVRSILGDLFDELQPGVRRELMRRSQGNPLYVEELARSLREKSGASTASVPSTLQGLLQSRIDRLPPAVQLLLEMASVLGSRFPLPLLSRMYRLETQTIDLDSALATLQTAGFVEPVEGDAEWHRFRHDLMQEVAHGRLLARVRRVLHESAARLGEEHYRQRIDAEAPFFAHHYWEAGLPVEAAPHLWRAGRTAAERYELHSAERLLERLARAQEEHPEALEAPEDRARFNEIHGTVLLQRGRLNDAVVWFSRLQELGEREDRLAWIALGHRYRGQVAWYQGKLDEALAIYEAGLKVNRPEDERIAADLYNGLACVHFYRENVEAALDSFQQALSLRRRLDDTPGAARVLSNIGSLLLDLREDLAGAEEYFVQAHALAQQVEDRQLRVSMLANLGRVAMERGEWKDGVARYRQVEQQAEEIGWSFLQFLGLRNRALCHLRLGELRDAVRCLETCIRDGEEVLDPVNRLAVRILLFEAWLSAAADARAQDALEGARATFERLEITDQADLIHLAEGRWLAANGDWTGAAAAFARAADAARRTGHAAHEDIARAHRSRAAARAGLEEEANDPDAARAAPTAPTAHLAAYLHADAAGTRNPSAEAARSLGEAAERAAERGEIALERAAFQRQAEIWSLLGEPVAAAAAAARAARTLEVMVRHLPPDVQAENLRGLTTLHR